MHRPHTFLVRGVAILGLATGLSAQIITGKTATAVGNAVTVARSIDSKSVRKGTVITPRGLSLTSTTAGSATATTRVTMVSSATTMSATLADTGRLASRSAIQSTAKTTGDAGRAGAHTVDFVLATRQTLRGQLIVTLSAGATGGTSSASMKLGGRTLTVRSGQRALRATFAITLTSRGYPISLTTNGSVALNAAGSANYAATVSFSFRYGAAGNVCTVQPGVRGCGPLLRATTTAGSGRVGPKIKLDLSNAAANAVGVLLFSADGRTTSVRGCPFFTTPLVPLTFRVSALGTHTVTLQVPPAKAFRFSVEEAVVLVGGGLIQIKATNTLNIGCRAR